MWSAESENCVALAVTLDDAGGANAWLEVRLHANSAKLSCFDSTVMFNLFGEKDVPLPLKRFTISTIVKAIKIDANGEGKVRN